MLDRSLSIGKYMPLFETRNTVAFLRNPVEQVVSHYLHFKTHHRYEKIHRGVYMRRAVSKSSIEISEAKPLELFGFIGLSERYEETIAIINDMFDLNLEVVHANKKVKDIEMSEEFKHKIIEINQDNIRIYQKAQKLFEQRLEEYRLKKGYGYLLIQENNEKIIRELAYRHNDDNTVKVDLNSLTGEKRCVEAKSFRSGLVHHNVPREGYVGFEYHKKDNKKL